MQVRVVLIIIIQLLLMVCQHVQTKPITPKSSLTMKHSNKTNILKPKSPLPTCISDRECRTYGWCEDGDCRCEKGWITLYNNEQCSYKQSSKIIAFILSFLGGSVGIDWFVLSRRDSLYILCGILKFLISAGCCIWSPLAARSNSKTATTAASCLSVSLTMIAFIWWLVDWSRILFNSFPDGNGAPLV